MSGPLLAAGDLAAYKPPVVTVIIPELDGELLLASPSSVRRDQVESDAWKDGQQDLANFKAKLVALCLVGTDGLPVYPDPVAGAEIVGQWDSRIVRRLYREARKLCPVGDEDLEVLRKNS